MEIPVRPTDQPAPVRVGELDDARATPAVADDHAPRRTDGRDGEAAGGPDAEAPGVPDNDTAPGDEYEPV